MTSRRLGWLARSSSKLLHRRIIAPRGGALGLVALACALLLGASSGCSATVGDGCTSNRECGFTHECDTSSPGGYCLIPNCKPNSCPAESWCASFTFLDRQRTYCLRKCKSDGDCRSGYKCRFELGTPGGVCFTGPLNASMP